MLVPLKAVVRIVGHGVRVFNYIDGEEVRLDTFMGKASLMLKGMGAEMERERGTQRANDTHTKKFHAGHVMGGFTYGYVNVSYYGHGACAGHVEPGPKRGDLAKIIRARLSRPWCTIEVAHNAKRDHVLRIIDPVEAALIIRIFDLFRDGSGLKAIAKGLNAEHIPSPSGGTWSKDTIRDILYRTEYRGIITDRQTKRAVGFKREGEQTTIVVDGTPRTKDAPELRIVTDEQWNEVHARLDAAKHLRDAEGRLISKAEKRSDVLLAGLTRCGVCGHAITRKRMPGGREVYVCSYRNARGTAVCTNGSYIETDMVNGALLAVIADTIFNVETIDGALDDAAAEIAAPPADFDAERERLTADVRKVETEIGNLVALAASSGSAALLAGLRAASARRRTCWRRSNALTDSRGCPPSTATRSGRTCAGCSTTGAHCSPTR